MDAIRIRGGEMGQLEIAAQHNVMDPTATIDGEETPATILTSETLKWKELTYRGRTFEFNREMHIRVLEEDGGWAYESDDPEIMGYGLTRTEAELTFCLGFAAQWNDLACEEDGKLTQGAREVKRGLLALVKAQK
jgi:hypothetical protein